MRTTILALATAFGLTLSGAAMAQNSFSTTGGPTGSNLSNPDRAGGAGPQPLNSAGSTAGSIGGIGTSPGMSTSPGIGSSSGSSLGNSGGFGGSAGGGSGFGGGR